MKSNYEKKYIWCLKNVTGKVVASKKRPFFSTHADLYDKQSMVVDMHRQGIISTDDALAMLTEINNLLRNLNDISSNTTS